VGRQHHSDDHRKPLKSAAESETASHRLIPRWLLVKHMQRQQWLASDLSNPDIAYQLSLRLGASYVATCHALQQNKVFGAEICNRLLAVKRREIKKRLAAPYEPADWRRDVWVITERDDGILLEGSKADLVVVKVHEHSGSGYLWGLDDLEKVGLAVVKDSRAADPDEDDVGSMVLRTVISEAIDGAFRRVSLREVRPWQKRGEALHSVNLELDLSGPEKSGLYKAQRRKALSGSAPARRHSPGEIRSSFILHPSLRPPRTTSPHPAIPCGASKTLRGSTSWPPKLQSAGKARLTYTNKATIRRAASDFPSAAAVHSGFRQTGGSAFLLLASYCNLVRQLQRCPWAPSAKFVIPASMM
jgi:hypothetical protein